MLATLGRGPSFLYKHLRVARGKVQNVTGTVLSYVDSVEAFG